MRHSESKLQSECIRYFRLMHPTLAMNFFSIPNGVCTSATQARILVREGMTAGVADTFLAVPNSQYHGAFLEFKKEEIEWKEGWKHTSRGYQSRQQKTFQAYVEVQGYNYTIIRNFDEFTAFMRQYLNQ